MGNRKAKDNAAIEDSQRDTEQKKAVERDPRQSGSDIDEQLKRFFSGAFAEIRCSLGSAGGGGGGGDESAPPPSVKLGLLPNTYSDAALVHGALSMLTDAQVRVLRAFYSPRAPWAFHGMIVFDHFAPVAALTDRAGKLAAALVVETRDKDIAKTEAAIEAAAKDTAERRAEMRAKVAKLADAKDHMRVLQRESLERALAQAEKSEQSLDILGDVRRKWNRPPTVDETKEALRRLCRTAKEARGEPRVDAGKAVEAILRDAREAHRDARAAYVDARKRVRGEIRQVRANQKAARLAAFAQSLEVA